MAADVCQIMPTGEEILNWKMGHILAHIRSIYSFGVGGSLHGSIPDEIQFPENKR